MDLEIQDVSELLQLSISEVEELINDKGLPAYRLKETAPYRFSKMEIEEWMMKHQMPFKSKEESASTSGFAHFSLFRAINKGGVLIDVEGDSKEEVIKNSIHAIAEDLELDEEVIIELLLDRENLMPTALGHGIGVPHARDFLLEKQHDIILVSYPKEPLEYGALDDSLVHTLFFLFACQDKRHLHLLAKLAHFSSQEDNVAFLKTKPNKSDLLTYIKHWESHF